MRNSGNPAASDGTATALVRVGNSSGFAIAGEVAPA